MLKKIYNNANQYAGNALSVHSQDSGCCVDEATACRYQVVAAIADVINVIISVAGVSQTLTFSAVDTSVAVRDALVAALASAGYTDNPGDAIRGVVVTDNGTNFTINIHVLDPDLVITSINIGAADEAATKECVQISECSYILDTPGGTGMVVTVNGTAFVVGDFTHGTQTSAQLQTELQADLDTAEGITDISVVDNAGADGYLITITAQGGTSIVIEDAANGAVQVLQSACVAEWVASEPVWTAP